MGLGFWLLMLILTPITGGLNWVLFIGYWFAKKVGKWVIFFFFLPVRISIAILELLWKAFTGATFGTAGAVKEFIDAGKGNIEKDKTGEGQGDQRSQQNQSQDYQSGGGQSEGSGGMFSNFFSDIKGVFGKYKLRYIAVFFVFLYFDYNSFLGAIISNPSTIIPSPFSIVGFLDVLPMIALAATVPFLGTILVSAIADKLTGNSQKAKNKAKAAGTLGGTGAAAGAAGAGGAVSSRGREVAGKAADVSENAMTTYSHLSTAKHMAQGGAEAAGEESILMSVLSTLGLDGLISGGAASAGGLGSSIVASGGTILIVLLILVVVWVITSLIAIAIAAIIAGLLWGYIAGILPILAGPVLGALGLGSAYANWFGQSASNSAVAISIFQGDMFTEEKRALAQAGAKIGCMLKGPQCLRQWRMNNTVRPGSEARGERYELNIVQFGLGKSKVDVAYKEANYTLPVNFLVSNTRHGLKGIKARNVSYKISVLNSEKTFCTTGWSSISSFDDRSKDYILPGLGVTPTESLEELNLGNCGLLQPSMGKNVVMELQVKYQYSSQATLYVDAMSRKYRREKGITPSFKKSKTAKTPVQSYINVKQPITFYTTESGERKVVPFAARFGFETPGFNVRYKVNPESVQIVDSSLTTNTSTCNGLKPAGQENYYGVSDAAERRINLRQQRTWFDADTSPSSLRCTMRIEDEDVGQISPTGEQLVMRIDANYTVVKEDQMTGFDVVNTICTERNCPLLVTQGYASSAPSEYDLYSKCSTSNSIDARDGCAIRVPESSEMNWRLPNLAEENGTIINIESGMIAKRLENFLANAPSYVPIGDKKSLKSNYAQTVTNGPEYAAYGTPSEQDIQRETVNTEGVIFYEEDSKPHNVQMNSLRGALCEEERRLSGSIDAAMRQYMAKWAEDQQGTRPLQIVVSVQSCSDTIEQYLVDSTSCTVNQGVNLLGATVQFANPFDSVNDDQFKEQACQSAMDQVRSCTGVLVEQRNRLRCYGGSFQ